MQTDMFQGPAMCRSTAKRLAVQRADDAVSRVADKADRMHEGWTAIAIEALRVFARNTPGLFLVEHARAVIAPTIPEPHDLRAWGRVTRDARKLGYIVPTGDVARAASSNNCLKELYRRGPQA